MYCTIYKCICYAPLFLPSQWSNINFTVFTYSILHNIKNNPEIFLISIFTFLIKAILTTLSNKTDSEIEHNVKNNPEIFLIFIVSQPIF